MHIFYEGEGGDSLLTLIRSFSLDKKYSKVEISILKEKLSNPIILIFLIYYIIDFV